MKNATVKIIWSDARRGWDVFVNKSKECTFVSSTPKYITGNRCKNCMAVVPRDLKVCPKCGRSDYLLVTKEDTRDEDEVQIIPSEYSPKTHRGGFNSFGPHEKKGEGYSLDTISCQDGVSVRLAMKLFEGADLYDRNTEEEHVVCENMLMVLYQSDFPGLYVAGMVMTGCSANFKI